MWKCFLASALFAAPREKKEKTQEHEVSEALVNPLWCAGSCGLKETLEGSFMTQAATLDPLSLHQNHLSPQPELVLSVLMDPTCPDFHGDTGATTQRSLHDQSQKHCFSNSLWLLFMLNFKSINIPPLHATRHLSPDSNVQWNADALLYKSHYNLKHI